MSAFSHKATALFSPTTPVLQDWLSCWTLMEDFSYIVSRRHFFKLKKKKLELIYSTPSSQLYCAMIGPILLPILCIILHSPRHYRPPVLAADCAVLAQTGRGVKVKTKCSGGREMERKTNFDKRESRRQQLGQMWRNYSKDKGTKQDYTVQRRLSN